MAGTAGAITQPPAQASYLGQGVKYPLDYDLNTGRLKLSSGTDSVTDALRSILQTQPGERPMQPDYGGDVGTFDPVDSARLVDRIQETVRVHEPRIVDLDVRTFGGPTVGEIQVTVNYRVAGQANPQTLTLPYFTPTAVAANT